MDRLEGCVRFQSRDPGTQDFASRSDFTDTAVSENPASSASIASAMCLALENAFRVNSDPYLSEAAQIAIRKVRAGHQ